MRFFGRLKKEVFYFRKAFFEYRAGWRYFYNKFFLAPEILRSKKIFHSQGSHPQPAVSIHVLTGKSDLVMCLWSLASFFERSSIKGELFIHSDGSLLTRDEKAVKKLFPFARIVSESQALNRAAVKFRSYPGILNLRQNSNFVLLKKLLDPLAVSNSPVRLVIDSDLVWFKKPEELEAALRDGVPYPLMMSNNGAIYVYFADGSRISETQASLNSGIVLFRQEQLSLSRLEEYLSKLDFNNPQTRHFIEQAGFAWALDRPKALPSGRYAIKAAYSEILALKHYTSPRRAQFYLEALPRLKDQFLG